MSDKIKENSGSSGQPNVPVKVRPIIVPTDHISVKGLASDKVIKAVAKEGTNKGRGGE